MSIFDQRTAKVLGTICAFVAIGAFLYGVRHTLVAILFAVLFAYLLEPVVYRIERSKARERLALARDPGNLFGDWRDSCGARHSIWTEAG